MTKIEQQENGSAERQLKALFQHVTARDRAPDEVEQKVFAAVHAEWLHLFGRHRRRQLTAWAVVACVVMALLLFFNLPGHKISAVQRQLSVSVEMQSGDILVQGGEGDLASLSSAAQLVTGRDLITQGNSGVSLGWGSGESLRLDQNSRIKLISDSEIAMLSGRLYVDSRVAHVNSHSLSIRTPVGLVSHLGTQYMVGVNDAGTGISVREGKVSIAGANDSAIASVGQSVFVYKDGSQAVTSVATYGESWLWAEQLVPPYNMDGHTLQDFLTWVGRETGRRIIYGSAAAEEMAREAQLHGSVALEPLRALQVLLQTSDLVYLLQDDTIVISTNRDV